MSEHLHLVRRGHSFKAQQASGLLGVRSCQTDRHVQRRFPVFVDAAKTVEIKSLGLPASTPLSTITGHGDYRAKGRVTRVVFARSGLVNLTPSNEWYSFNCNLTYTTIILMPLGISSNLWGI